MLKSKLLQILVSAHSSCTHTAHHTHTHTPHSPFSHTHHPTHASHTTHLIAIEMRSRQEEIDRLTSEIDIKGKELANLQTKLQEAERILVCNNQ